MKIITQSVSEWNGTRYVTVEETAYEYDGPIAHCGSSGGKTVQTAEPWSEAKPYFERMYQRAEELSTEGAPQYYPGSTVAQQSPFTTAGQQMLLNYIYGTGNAPQVGTPTISGYGGQAQSTTGQQALVPGVNTQVPVEQTNQQAAPELAEGMASRIAYGWGDLADAQGQYRIAQASARQEPNQAMANRILQNAQLQVDAAAENLRSQGWVEPGLSTSQMVDMANQRSNMDWWNQNYGILPAYGG